MPCDEFMICAIQTVVFFSFCILIECVDGLGNMEGNIYEPSVFNANLCLLVLESVTAINHQTQTQYCALVLFRNKMLHVIY